MPPALAALLLVCSVGPVLAEDRDARASDELEHALREMVKLPPATVEVVFNGIDSTRYKLLEASFALDDRPLRLPGGSNVLFAGEIQPGRHTLSTTLVYEAPAPTHGSIKYKVPGKFIFTAQRGVLMRVRARIEVDDGAEPSKRLQLMGQAEADLRAKLEDSLPPEHERPEMADNTSKQKQPTSAGATRPLTTTEEPRWREAENVSGAAASALAPSIQPAVAKRKASRVKETSPVVDAAAAAAATAERPAEATPPPEEHKTPSSEAIAVEQRAAPQPASPAAAPPPAVTTPEALARLLGYLRDFGTAIAGSAMALIGLLLLAAARKKR